MALPPLFLHDRNNNNVVGGKTRVEKRDTNTNVDDAAEAEEERRGSGAMHYFEEILQGISEMEDDKQLHQVRFCDENNTNNNDMEVEKFQNFSTIPHVDNNQLETYAEVSLVDSVGNSPDSSVNLIDLEGESDDDVLLLLCDGSGESAAFLDELVEDALRMGGVYSIALQSVQSEHDLRLLAETLHQRWLSDADFVVAAARLAFQLNSLSVSNGDVRFGSILFALLMNDFRDRHKFRQASASVLCNSAHFAFQFYDTFRASATFGAFYECLIDPLLDYMDMLVEENNCTEQEVELAAMLLKCHGAHFQTVRFRRMADICLHIRQILIRNAATLSPFVRATLMHIIELSAHRWDDDRLPTGVAQMYQKVSEETRRQSRLPVMTYKRKETIADAAKERDSSLTNVDAVKELLTMQEKQLNGLSTKLNGVNRLVHKRSMTPRDAMKRIYTIESLTNIMSLAHESSV